ncbi:MAG: ATP-binding protein [Acholeplasmataceae bacterium]
MYKRTLKKEIEKLIKQFPVVLISGPRQVGKSTLVHQFTHNGFSYVSLDNLNIRASANADPLQFIQSYKLPLIIDEVQYEPKLFDVIQSIVNQERIGKGEANGLFILTGSQEINLEKGIESMAGRVAIINMYGLSLSELHGVEELPFIPSFKRANERKDNYIINKKEVFELIVRGFLPELHRNKNIDSEIYFQSYVQTYIERDVMQIINIKDKLLFQSFLRYIAALTGQELITSHIAKALNIRNETVNSWLSILIASKIIFLLYPYNEFSLTKRVIKRPKIYFTDTGLAAYLARLSHPENLAINKFSGAFFETFVINEIMKSYTNNGKTFPGFYYRDNNQNEIDLVLVSQGKMNLIEIKTGMSFNKSDANVFNILNKTKFIKETHAIISLSDRVYSIGKDIFVIPIQSI